MLRLFIALEPPPPLRDELAAVQSRFDPLLPLRRVAADGIHLTLQFLGDTPANQVAPLRQALARLPQDPIRLRLDRLGVFPNPRRPQVLWVGLAGDLAVLQARRQQVIAATGALGFQAERQAFKPHLTIARVRPHSPPEQFAAIAAALQQIRPPQPLAWDAAPPRLIQSTLTPQGAIYRDLGP
ncbi:MAG: RNA 2',3'-cyclic phosphodiesterase [Oscillochloris sp.]|nr:RNA 2',3'-cyclic phosphodiesterase [Oscillochloris sp.]